MWKTLASTSHSSQGTRDSSAFNTKPFISPPCPSGCPLLPGYLLNDWQFSLLTFYSGQLIAILIWLTTWSWLPADLILTTCWQQLLNDFKRFIFLSWWSWRSPSATRSKNCNPSKSGYCWVCSWILFSAYFFSSWKAITLQLFFP